MFDFVDSKTEYQDTHALMTDLKTVKVALQCYLLDSVRYNPKQTSIFFKAICVDLGIKLELFLQRSLLNLSKITLKRVRLIQYAHNTLDK